MPPHEPETVKKAVNHFLQVHFPADIEQRFGILVATLRVLFNFFLPSVLSQVFTNGV
jgi:hypothetical protein